MWFPDMFSTRGHPSHDHVKTLNRFLLFSKNDSGYRNGRHFDTSAEEGR